MHKKPPAAIVSSDDRRPMKGIAPARAERARGLRLFQSRAPPDRATAETLAGYFACPGSGEEQVFAHLRPDRAQRASGNARSCGASGRQSLAARWSEAQVVAFGCRTLRLEADGSAISTGR